MNNQSIEEKINSLPNDLKSQVSDFIDFLIDKRNKKTYAPFSFDWEGKLSGLDGEYDSVDLQHKALGWR